MKKALILTTLMTSAVGASIQTDAFADEKDNQNKVSHKSARITETTTKGKVVNLKSGDTLNVREKSNADSKLLFTLNNGEIITVLNEESNGWLKIQKGSQEGYVNGYYISTYTEVIEKAIVTDAVNLRASASWSGEKIAVVSKGTWLTVLSKGSEWTKVSYNNQEGYVPTSYLNYEGNLDAGKIEYATTTDAVNLRESASWSGEKIAVISKGTELIVLSKDSEWTKVSYDGKEGYVPTDYLNFNDNSDSSNVDKNEYATTTDAVNLRATASWSGEQIIVVPKNSKVIVISKGSEWTKVSYDGKEGYVPANYLNYENQDNNNNNGNTTPDNPSETTPSYTETDFSAKGKVVKIASNDVLNVRKEPSGDSALITTLKLNETVTITKKVSNGWYKVSANGSVGYVNGSYIEIIEEETAKYVTTDKVNLRSSKSWDSTAVILTIDKNEAVNLLEKDSDWAKIEYKNQIGYVPVNYIELVGGSDNQAPSVSDKVGKIGTVNATSLNVRSGPGTSYSILTKVYSGDTVLIKEVSSSGWYKIETMSGIIGWCSGDYISNIREGSLPSYGDTTDEKINNVLNLAKEQLGKPYKYGADGPDAFDCSGLTYYVFKNGAGITLPRNSSAQATAGYEVSKSDLKPGDFVSLAASP